MMRVLAIVLVAVAAVGAARLDNTYLPPSSSRTAGAANFLAPPIQQFGGRSSYAAPPSGPVSYGGGGAALPVAILRLNNDNNGDGTYRFEYETENRITQQESGHLKNTGTDQESSVVQGSYSYTAPDGVTYTVNYIADEYGFRPTGDHLPTPPPVPDAIAKSLRTGGAAGSSAFRSGYSPAVPDRQYLTPQATQRQSSGYHY